MPTYGYECGCGWGGDMVVPMFDRDGQCCPNCKRHLFRLPAAPLVKFTGRVTPGGGPDRFTADMLGIPLKELPSGLKTAA